MKRVGNFGKPGLGFGLAKRTKPTKPTQTAGSVVVVGKKPGKPSIFGDDDDGGGGGDDDDDDVFSKLQSKKPTKIPETIKSCPNIGDDKKVKASKSDKDSNDYEQTNDDDIKVDNTAAEAKDDQKDSYNKDSKDGEEKEEEEEEDPLEAFMAGITEQATKDAENMGKQPSTKPHQDLNEDDDDIEQYIEAMRKKGIKVGEVKNQDNPPTINIGEYDNSDDELYATAKRLDNGETYEDMVSGKARKKEIDPLPPVDHSAIDYPKIVKKIYKEHPDIESLDDQKAKEIRKKLDLRVTGLSHNIKPCVSFAHFGFDEKLLGAIANAKYTEPTDIQKQTIPIALMGHDIIGIAKTGSGKTAAYVWPMLTHISKQPNGEALPKNDDDGGCGGGPIALVLSPTRELAIQIYNDTKPFAKALGFKTTVIYGGASKYEQVRELQTKNPDILVATPSRLIDMIKSKATTLGRITFLVLDEADQMLNLGFENQVLSICNSIRPDRQTLLFSATFPRKIERLAHIVTCSGNDGDSRPIQISVGQIGRANADVRQHIVMIGEEHQVNNNSNNKSHDGSESAVDTGIFEDQKLMWLRSNLLNFTMAGSVLIFATRKDQVDTLTSYIQHQGFKCGGLHGDMLQIDRDKIIYAFKHQKINTLVATDVAARGLDIKSVRTVINYEAARNIESHTHRIGRTGRAGEKGDAYSLITPLDFNFAGHLVFNLVDADQFVPERLVDLALKSYNFKKRWDNYQRHSHGRGNKHGGHWDRKRHGGKGQKLGGNPLKNPGLSSLTSGSRLPGDKAGIGASSSTGYNKKGIVKPNAAGGGGSMSFGIKFKPASSSNQDSI
ncbi:hypothetical protein H4219_004322 [Mycoemilia scoparia]|uniref:RNA helicase n=1 Tax=Mycoemilia scoparia TaxID=417184 RepID=A0A9W8DN11_9FUNG|nr:hypothetical protein H4219_004322 [Mycoemilia scoparia]